MQRLTEGKANLIKYLAIPAAIATIICTWMLPFVTYKYKSKTYMLRGNAFITGKSICKGTYQLTPNVLIWISLVCLVLLVATILFLSRKKPRLAAILACIFAMIPLAFYLLLGYTLPLSIEAAKAVTRIKKSRLLTEPAL